MGTLAQEELILFYNVENLFLPDEKPSTNIHQSISGLRNWDQKKYKDKLEKIAQVMQLVQEKEGALPMIIGLSEIQGRKPLEDLVALPPFNSQYGIVHYNSMDERGVDVALLYDLSKIEILTSEPITFFFEIENTEPDRYDTTRDVLHCRLKYEAAIINVFVLHLPSKRALDINKPKRDYILNEIQEKILDINIEKKEAVILLGDFNENPDEENLLKILTDKNNNIILTNPFYDLYCKGYFSTFHFKNGLVFDNLIISNEFFKQNYPLRFTTAHVFNAAKLSSWDRRFSGRPFRTYAGTRYLGGYSDHYPVYIKLNKFR